MYSGVQVFINKTNKADWYCWFDTCYHYHLLYFSTAFPSKVHSQLWSHFILTTLRKRKGKSRIDENYSDPHSTDAQTESQKEVTSPRSPSEWAGGPGLWVAAQYMLLSIFTFELTLNADNVQPHMSLIPPNLAPPSLGKADSVLHRWHKLTITKWDIASRGHWWDFKDGVIRLIK